ncbi:MAG: sugar phosphate nucleotidyltransferase [Acidimicrobiales bacterium]
MKPAGEGLEVVILCGGRGTRAYPDTVELPKPLLTVGELPIVEHVMAIYAAQGHRRFVLATGHLGELIAERYAEPAPGRQVRVVDTGADTQTGERLRLAADHVEGERFFATYADGVGDVDLDRLLATHDRSGALATVTTVPLPSQYGTLVADQSGRVTAFQEKPILADRWINAGFFVLDRAVFGCWRGQVLESEVLPALCERGVLYAYRHPGFWKSMDTFKDRQELTAMAQTGDPPWGAPAPMRSGPEPVP